MRITSLIGYIFILLGFVCLTVIWLSYLGIMSELISLIILLVYVGAMAVLFIYVRAVSPNKSSAPLLGLNSNQFVVLNLVLFLGVSLLSSDFLNLGAIQSLGVSSEIFRGLGVVLTFSLVTLLILVLAAVTFVSPSSSTFRSIN